jgi:YHS domain-containing protein
MSRSNALAWALLLAPLACAPPGTTTSPDAGAAASADADADDLVGKPVVRNVDARAGDVTLCPYSGRKFLVTESSPRWEYEGQSYVFCHDKALGEVQKDPKKYFDGFEG